MLRNFIENIKKKKDVKEIVDRNKYDIESTKGHLGKERLTMSKLTEMKETGIADIDFFKTWDKKYICEMLTNSDMIDNAIAECQVQIVRFEQKIKNLEQQNEFVRPQTERDAEERKSIQENFANSVLNADKENKLDLRFHATSIMATRDIISSGGLFSVMDRLGDAATSTNDHGEISVGKVDEIQYSVDYWMDTRPDGNLLPCGCMFVLIPDDNERDMIANRQMHNVNFTQNPEKLFGIITTNENYDMVKGWMQDKNMDVSKLFTFDKFPEHLKEKVSEIEHTTLSRDEDEISL